MKIPKKLTIAGVEYIIEKDKTTTAGSFHTGEQKITVGTKSNEPTREFQTLLHEITEAALAENRFMYQKIDDNVPVFVMTHREFENAMTDITLAIYPLLKD